MSDYVPVSGSGLGDHRTQGPGPPPYNAYDRTSAPLRCIVTKTPSYVLVTKTMTKPFGFFYGTSASFAEKSVTEGNDPLNALTGIPVTGSLTGSSHYDSDWGLVTVGTRLDIHPMAWSGSVDDAGNLKFVYKSGRSTGPR